MKKYLLFLVVLLSWYSCSTSKVEPKFYVSEVYDEEFVLSKADSLYIKKQQDDDSLFLKQAQKVDLKFEFNNQWHKVELLNQETSLPELLRTHFEIPSDAKPSKNVITLIIGSDGVLKNYQIDYEKDKRVKSRIEKILQNIITKKRWKPAKVYGFSVESKAKIDLIIE